MTSLDVITFIQKNGFIRDVEDNVWYTKDYQKRVVPNAYNALSTGHLYYGNGGFNDGIHFTTFEELRDLILK